MANIILKDKNGTDITHMGIDYLCMRTLEGGLVRFNEGDIRVISVDELPSENIKEDAIYKVSATDEDGNANVVFYTYVDGEWTEYKVGKDPVFENLEITENGTYTPAEGVDGWSEVTVNVESNPVLTELVVTENGVYDEPMIGGGEPDFTVGNTVQFRESYAIDDFPAEVINQPNLANIGGLVVYIEGEGSMFVVTVISSKTINGEQLDGAYYYLSEEAAPAVGGNLGIANAEEGWYLVVSNDTAPIRADAPPSVIVKDEEYAEVYTNLSFFFAASPVPADGWNKVTVNVAGDIIDVDELPTENIDEGKIYRVTKESEPTVYIAGLNDNGEPMVISYAEMLYAGTSGQFNIVTHVHVVDSLPDQFEKTNIDTATMTYTVSLYIVRDTGIAYYGGPSGKLITLGEGHEVPLEDYGWVDSVDDIVPSDNMAYYTVRGSSSTTYGIPDEANNKTVFEHNGSEWVECGAGSGSGGGDNTVIDVESFPTENIDDSKIYRMNEEKEPIVWAAFEMGNEQLSVPFAELAVMMGVPNPTIYAYVVESLPDEMEPMDNSNGVFPCYVLESTGVAYVSQDGTSTTATSLSSMLDGADGGWVNSVDEIVLTEIPTFYTVRGGSFTHYGVPNDNDEKVLYEYTVENGWVALRDEITSLTEQNEGLVAEKESLVNQNAELTERIDNFFNIAYGDVEPTDTSKLWVQTNEPSDVIISSTVTETDKDGYASVLDTTMASAASECEGALVSGKLYFHLATGILYCFDPATSNVTQVSSNVDGECCASVGTKIYFFTGGSINCFDTEANTFQSVQYSGASTQYNETSRMRCAAVGTKIYIFGGWTYNGWTASTWCFNTETNELTACSGAPKAYKERVFGIVVVGTDIYLSIDRELYCYHTESNTYSESLMSLQNDYLFGDFAAIDSTIYCFGGYDKNTICAYDINTKTSTILNNTLKYDGRYSLTVNIDDKIYLLGGGSTEHNKIQCFYPFEKTLLIEENKLQIIPSLEENIFRLTNEESKSVEIGVNRVYKGDSYGEAALVPAALYKDGAWTNLY